MGVNFIDEYLKLKSAYASQRGISRPTGKKNRSTGQLLVPPSKGIPNTTWGDAVVMWTYLKKTAEPTLDQCLAQGRKKGVNNLAFYCSMPPPNGIAFVRSSTFNRAARDFDAQNPTVRAGLAAVATNIPNNTVYPFNEELWGYADDYALARNAAGQIRFPFEIAIESISEAIREAPGLVGAALSKLDPRNLVPALDWFRDALKWGAIGGGLFMLYWYVLRPRNNER